MAADAAAVVDAGVSRTQLVAAADVSGARLSGTGSTSPSVASTYCGVGGACGPWQQCMRATCLRRAPWDKAPLELGRSHLLLLRRLCQRGASTSSRRCLQQQPLGVQHHALRHIAAAAPQPHRRQLLGRRLQLSSWRPCLFAVRASDHALWGQRHLHIHGLWRRVVAPTLHPPLRE